MTDLIERTLLGLSNQLGNRVSRPGDGGDVAATEIWAKPIGCMPRTVVHCRTPQDVQFALAPFWGMQVAVEARSFRLFVAVGT